ncbi:MAG: phosphotransferase, partial [Microbacterium sp.]
DMARSPFTLVAAVTAALPGAEVTGARPLTSGGDGRFDSAVATLADGRELTIRVADDDDAARELAAESIALRALTAGAREMLPFRVPEYVGETRIGEGRALVTDLLPGFQIDADQVPAGRGAAPSMGAAIAALHALPASVVRGAGLTMRSAEECRAEVRQLIDRAAASGQVPARLTVRWRGAVDDDELWRFQPAVTLGGVQADSFLFADDDELGPRVVGAIGWHGLSVGDPALDLAWLSSAPDAAADVHEAYANTSGRAVDAALDVRARLHAELEFARWLVHGESLRRADIVADAAALLESLAESAQDDLRVHGEAHGVDSAMDALDRVPETPVAGADTSMQTDAYRPEDLWAAEAEDETDGEGGAEPESPDEPDPRASAPEEAPVASEDQKLPLWAGDPAEQETQDLTDLAAEAEAAGVTGVRGSHGAGLTDAPPADTAGTTAGADASGTTKVLPLGDSEDPLDSAEEAQRAARAALQRWTSSSSE